MPPQARTGKLRSRTGPALTTDSDASFDQSVDIDATQLEPHVTWGTNPAHVIPISAPIPGPDSLFRPRRGRNRRTRFGIYGTYCRQKTQ